MVGEFGGTFSANWDRIPAELADQLTPEQLGWMVDLLTEAYMDGQRQPPLRSTPDRWRVTAGIARRVEYSHHILQRYRCIKGISKRCRRTRWTR